ncbi:MAG: permease-like cell division protein FtsX [Halofilum sp. (in: g-proteobacteria)]|nr:permease-like cell division protein FtsX [Halofilum sp. (in: g-proteobacteria)]
MARNGSERKSNRTERKTARPGWRPTVWLAEHARAALGSLGRLWRNPVASLLTLAVIAVALALPGALWLLLKNAQDATGGWDSGTQISVYLEPGLDEDAVAAAADRIAARKDVRVIERISAEQALAEFRELAGSGEALAALERNPLPAVVVLEPAAGAPRSPSALGALAGQLDEIGGVDQARVDLEWVERMYALLDVVERGVTLLAVLLAAGVLLIVGNTIRLDILNRRDEIEVTKLIGASDAFIRRPFLYGGLWYGLGGAVSAWLLLALTSALLSGPTARLASAYGSQFRLEGLTLAETGLLLGLGTVLGWAGSWLAVGRHLREIEPG